jgi:hypothetical protein
MQRFIHTLPALSLVFTSLDDLEHLLLGNTSDFGQRHGVLGGSVLSSILDRRTERFGVLGVSIERVNRSIHNRTF